MKNGDDRDTGKGTAFTLIELLVVVAIIAILAALFVPAVTSALERGRVALCMSNLRQIAVAQRLYLNDHENRFYEYVQDGSGPDREAAQGGIPYNNEYRPLNQYISLEDSWKCPSDRGRVDNFGYFTPINALKPHIWSRDKWGTSYFFNTFGVSDTWSPGIGNPYYNDSIHNDAALISRPGIFVLFYEYPFGDVNRRPEAPGLYRYLIGGGWGLGGAGNFHEPYFQDPTANVAFADGHVANLQDFAGWGEVKDGAYTFISK